MYANFLTGVIFFGALYSFREAQFEVKVCPRARTTSPSDQDVVVYLLTTLTYRAPTLVFSDEKRSFAIPGAGAVLQGDAYISAGCDAAQLVRDALALLAGQKLDVLAERIRYSAGKIGVDAATVITPPCYFSWSRGTNVSLSLFSGLVDC